jgi:hypothetical protein
MESDYYKRRGYVNSNIVTTVNILGSTSDETALRARYRLNLDGKRE